MDIFRRVRMERPGASNVRLMTPSSAGEKDLSVVTTSLGFEPKLS